MALSLSSEKGPCKTVKARLWPWLAGKSLQNVLVCFIFAHAGVSRAVLPRPLSSELGTNESVKARFWPWLEPFSVQMSLRYFTLFPQGFSELLRRLQAGEFTWLPTAQRFALKAFRSTTLLKSVLKAFRSTLLKSVRYDEKVTFSSYRRQKALIP